MNLNVFVCDKTLVKLQINKLIIMKIVPNGKVHEV